MDSARPLPRIEEHTRAYWEGAQRGELLIQRCDACANWIHPPRHTCPRCQSEDVTATKASGDGTIYAYSIMHIDGGPGFHDPPYAVVVVELAEQDGLITIGNLLDCPVADIKIGLPVRVDFQPVTDEVTLPQWRLAG